MLSQRQETLIETLLAQGLPPREVAKRAGCSRWTADQRMRGVRPHERRGEEPETPVYVRCRNCGGLVNLPCRLCAARGM